MKEVGTTHWIAPNTGATNSSGFTALPAGYTVHDAGGGPFYGLGIETILWSITAIDDDNVWALSINNSREVATLKTTNTKRQGRSVRLVKD